METNVSNKSHSGNFQKRKIATQALKKVLDPKPVISIIWTHQYMTYVDIFYLSGKDQKQEQIGIQKLEDFIRECYHLLPGNDGIDMNISIYLQEDLKAVCTAYLTHRKGSLSC